MNLLNGFVDNGSDEALVKSLEVETEEDLEKAIDKNKLVQVERQVQGKNKMFTRKQWVKSSDVKSTDKVIGGQTPKDSKPTHAPFADSTSNYDHKQFGQTMSEANKKLNATNDSYSVVHTNLGYVGYSMTTPSGNSVKIYEMGHSYDNSKYLSVSISNGKGGFIQPKDDSGKQIKFNTVDEIKDWIDKNTEFGNKKKSTQTSKKDSGDKKPYKTYTDKASGTTNIVGKFDDTTKKKLIEGMKKKGYEVDTEHTGKLPDGNEQISFKKPENKPDSKKLSIKDLPNSTVLPTAKNSKSEPKKQTSKIDQSVKDKVGELSKKFGNDKLVDWLKNNGVIWKESDNKGINIMRAKMAMSQAMQTGDLNVESIDSSDDSQTTKKPEAPKQKAPSQDKATYFKATQDTKNKVNDLSKQMGNDKLLDMAKKNGVTWTEHDHKGINIMRMKMAVAQAIQEGKWNSGNQVSSKLDTKKQTSSSKYSKKTAQLIDGFDKEISSDNSSTYEEFASSNLMKYANSLVNRLEQLDDEGESSLGSDDDVAAIKKEFNAVYKRLKSLRSKAEELEKKLPGGNWSSLPSGSSERIKAVDEFDKSKRVRDRVNKKLYPQQTTITYFKNGI